MMAADRRDDEWLTIPEVAADLKVSEATVRRYVNLGRLEACAAGTGAVRPRLRVERGALKAFKAATRIPLPTRRQRRAA